jgi:hypothetical protein
MLLLCDHVPESAVAVNQNALQHMTPQYNGSNFMLQP